jgi:hypothetical protein
MLVHRIARSALLAPLVLALVVGSAQAEGPPASHPTAHGVPAGPPGAARLPPAPAAPGAGRALHVPGTTPRLPARVDSRAHAPSALVAQTPSLDVPLPRAEARRQLVGVREEVARRASLGERPIVVFDIDDTLLTWPHGDTPRTVVPGALAYVTSLEKAGARIVYITGRGANTRAETEAHLRDHGFPLASAEQLVLNDTELTTVEFKAKATRDLVRTHGVPVAAFDNEKENARMFRRELPDPRVTVVRLRTTTQRPDAGGDGPISVIDDFQAAPPASLHRLAPADPAMGTASRTVSPTGAAARR